MAHLVVDEAHLGFALLPRHSRSGGDVMERQHNTFGFNRIDWAPLNLAATVTTVSRYMKFRMWEVGQNPIVIPNGIPAESIVEPDAPVVKSVRLAARADDFWFKIGRFDPDKRWLMAVGA